MFAGLPHGTSIFLDANRFVFHFQSHAQFGPPCTALLQRIERQELVGYCSTHVLGEVSHRLMTIEARSNLGWTSGKLVRRLKQNPAAVKSLTAHRIAIQEIFQSRLQIVSVSPTIVATASAVIQQHGLLTNDALIVAIMQNLGLTNLASHDADFDRVPGITRYAPA